MKSSNHICLNDISSPPFSGGESLYRFIRPVFLSFTLRSAVSLLVFLLCCHLCYIVHQFLHTLSRGADTLVGKAVENAGAAIGQGMGAAAVSWALGAATSGPWTLFAILLGKGCQSEGVKVVAKPVPQLLDWSFGGFDIFR